MIKYLLIFVILFSSSIAEGHGNKRWKKGHKKKYRNNKHKIHKVVYRPKPNIKINYGYHGYLRPWRYLYPWYKHNNVVVIKNEEKVLDNSSDVFAKIEQLGALKESGLITEKEFQKAKKELLKRI